MTFFGKFLMFFLTGLFLKEVLGHSRKFLINHSLKHKHEETQYTLIVESCLLKLHHNRMINTKQKKQDDRSLSHNHD